MEIKSEQERATPRPWRQFDEDDLEILAADKHEVCVVYQCGGIREIDEAVANAALIVRAVNAHDELIAAAKAAKTFLEGVVFNRARAEKIAQQLESAIQHSSKE